MPDKRPPEPQMIELATAQDGRDITKGYVDKLMQQEDAVLLSRSGGDLKVYEELLRDDQVQSTWQQRRLAVTSKDWYVEPASDSSQDQAIADALTENLKEIRFDSATEKMMYGILYGYSVGEVLWQKRDSMIAIGDIKVRRAKRFRFGSDGQLYLLTTNNPMGELMPDRKFWTMSVGTDNSDNPYGLGLGHQLYWPVFFKRNGIKFWLIFLEKFAAPTALAKLPSVMADNAAERAKVLEALRAISTDAAVTVPDNVAVEFIEAARSGTADYEALMQRMNAAISKVVLSQTMTTDDGSSRSQSETHKSVRDEVVKADSDLLCESFNRSVVKWWAEYNFPGAEPPRVWRKLDEERDALEQADLDKKIWELGFEPSEEYIKRTYGEDWAKKQTPEPLQDPFQMAPPEFAEAAGRLLAQGLQHRNDQQAIVDAARNFGEQYEKLIGPRYDSLLAALEESGDLLTFRERLNELVGGLPPDITREQLQRAGIVSRLKGIFRNRS